MAIYHATADPKLKIEGKQYSMFIGRWQPWHPGHRWLIDQALNKDKNVLICIRDIEPDEKNPWYSIEVMSNLHKELADLIDEGRVRVMIIPDIDSVNFGRGVGYDVIEHEPPTEVKEISATKIREQMKLEGKL
jgi:nicotinamide mononucleotide adenylyltransferase